MLRKLWAAFAACFETEDDPVGVPGLHDYLTDYGWVPLLVGGTAMTLLAIFHS